MARMIPQALSRAQKNMHAQRFWVHVKHRHVSGSRTTRPLNAISSEYILLPSYSTPSKLTPPRSPPRNPGRRWHRLGSQYNSDRFHLRGGMAGWRGNSRRRHFKIVGGLQACGIANTLGNRSVTEGNVDSLSHSRVPLYQVTVA